MNKWRIIIVAAAVVLGGLYALARLALQANSAAEVPVVAVEQPPAPYPADFEAQLGRLTHIAVSLHTEGELPRRIPWQTAESFPDIGSPQAQKGGCLRVSNVGPYPANFLAFGSPSPQFFHYNLFDCIEVPLVREHPQTGQTIPGLANAWASYDGMLWFRLDSRARYSNGRPVRAADFALSILLRHRTGDAAIEHFAEELHVFGDAVLAVRPKQMSYAAHLRAAAYLRPAEPGFYREFGADYTTRYAQRIPPTTGAYTVCKTRRGRLICLSRNPHWWARDIKGFRFTHNADTIEHHFLTDEAQAWELFLRGKLDMMQTRNIVAWQDKLRQADARIILHRFILRYPMPPYGIALNAEQLPNIHLRRGLLHAMDMKKAMNVIFRGEAEQLPRFASGYNMPEAAPLCYAYSPQAAEQCFLAAGYTHRGKDGIWQKADGTRLSVRLAFSPSEKISTLVALLAQSAARCGAEIIADPRPWQNCASLVQDKRHHMLFWATVAARPLPDYRSAFHSSSTGANAPFCLQHPPMDAAIEALETAATQQQVSAACAEVEQLIQHLAIWLPGWMENQVNVAAWPHVQLPRADYAVYDVADAHTLWITP